MFKKIKKSIAVFAVVLLMSSGNGLEANTNSDPNACWAGADAAEIFICGSSRCNDDLWNAVYDACMGWGLK